MLFLGLLMLCSLSVFEENLLPGTKIVMLNLTVVDLMLVCLFVCFHNRYK